MFKKRLGLLRKHKCRLAFFSSLRVTNSFCIYLLSIANAPRSPSVLLSSCAQMGSCANAGLQRRRPALRRVVASASRTSAQGSSPLRCIRSHRHKAFLYAGKSDLISFLFFHFLHKHPVCSLAEIIQSHTQTSESG